MKKILTLLLLVVATTTVNAQTPTPTSWNFDDPIPNGWEESLMNNPGNTRYSNGAVGAACRLDGDDEYVVVNFADVCGSVTYFIAGLGNASNDVFTVEESADGAVWTELRLFEEADLDQASTWTEFTDMPLATTRYIRWHFTEKQSGRNVGLDEISLTEQVPTNDSEIRVYSGTDDVPNNSTFFSGNAATTVMNIENVNLLGGDILNISSMVISGPNAGDFSISGVTTPFQVGPSGVQGFNLDFTAGGTGSRFATLTIDNDDANGDEIPYVINLYGIGGNYATEPIDQPTNLAFSNVTSYGYDVAFDEGATNAENYIVLRSIGLPIPAADNPVDGTTYVKGDYINGTQVVHVGAAGSFRPKYVVAGQQYYFAAYAFNGPSGYENYLTGAPLTGDVTSSGSMMGNYYQGIDPGSASFLTDLQTRITWNYNQIFYSNYAPIMIDKFASRDTTGGQSVVTGVYSGYQHIYTGAFFYDVLSREHSWPHSWMPTFPDQEGEEYSDFHNLFLVHNAEVDAVRSNRPLGEVVNQTSSFINSQYGDDSNGNLVFEPRDQFKGDAARAIFYMALKWNGTGGSWELPNPIDFVSQYGQDQDVLKQWHWQDPPDAWEIARNDFIESEQGNRNPFIDSVNWVCYIDFESIAHIADVWEFPCNTTNGTVVDEICLVTVDTLSGYNQISWEKTLGISTEYYKIYKQNNIFSIFDSIGSVNIDSLSTFVDFDSNPNQSSNRYRISMVKSSGYETVPSDIHRTIHLLANQGINGEVNLSWNAYEGFSYSNFEIYRSNNAGPFNLIGTTSNSNFSYSDLTPPSGTNYYRVAVVNPNSCAPTRSVSRSISNVINSSGTTVGVTGVQASINTIVYPNPSNGNFAVSVADIEGVINLSVFDVRGLEVFTTVIVGNGQKTIQNIDLSNYANGVYTLRIRTAKGIATQKLIKE